MSHKDNPNRKYTKLTSVIIEEELQEPVVTTNRTKLTSQDCHRKDKEDAKLKFIQKVDESKMNMKEKADEK